MIRLNQGKVNTSLMATLQVRGVYQHDLSCLLYRNVTRPIERLGTSVRERRVERNRNGIDRACASLLRRP
jgi:hypothetical protein